LNIKDYLTIKPAAALLGVSVNTLRNWERGGKLVAHRHPINGYRLYKRVDLEALLAAIEQPRPAKIPHHQ
jgi:excisionase family DNA binding protein